jgi:membrane associated rhomboid family serine protease
MNLAAYLLELASGGQATCATYGLVPAHFSIGTLISSMFLHDPSSLLHLGGNMVFLVIFGSVVEREIGHLRFLGLYLLAGVLGGLMHVLVDPSASAPLVGASGAIFGVLAVAGALRPRLLGFVVSFVGINIFHAFFGGGGDVSFGCHIGGFCAGVVLVAMMRIVGHESMETA